MKKRVLKGIYGRYMRKYFLIMKITAILMLISLFQVHATTFAQKKKLSIQVTNGTVESVLEQIEKSSEFAILYHDELVDLKRKVTIDSKESTIDQVLDELFKGTSNGFVIMDRHIVITKSDDGLQQADNTRIIKGKVTDKLGEPLPGVNVYEKEHMQNGVITGIDGSYEIKAISEESVLVFSFIGFTTLEIQTAGRSSINITLLEDAISLDEVVAIGYGVAKKSDLTGAISSVATDEIVKTTATSIDQVLGGRAAGLIAMQKSGQPGSAVNIQIRGNASFASSGVLYVVDGVPVNGGASDPGSGTVYGGVDRSPLSFINPSDIESIEVLKDASSAAIYGARAGAGVILITTKKGKKGKPSISYDMSHAFQKPFGFYDIYTEKEYMINRNDWERESYNAKHGLGIYGDNPDNMPPYSPRYSDTEIAEAKDYGSALDEVQRDGFMQIHNLSMSGGTDHTTYFVSGNYTKQKGVLINSGLEKFSLRTNLDQKIGEKVTFGLNMTTAREDYDNAAVGGGQFQDAGVILSAFYHPPTIPLIDEDGNYPLNPEYSNAPNPLSFREITDHSLNRRFLGTTYLKYDIMEGLSVQGKYSYDYSNIRRSSYLPKSTLYGQNSNGEADIRENQTEIKLSEISVNYNNELFEGHSLDAVFVYSYQVAEGDHLSAGNKDFLTDNFLYNNLGLGESEKPSVGSSRWKEVWASYTARARYSINNKYLITASIRRDGASKFAENKKYGWFPSASIGWKIKNEPFLEDVNWLYNLKLRASYGSTGNSNIKGNAFSYYTPGRNYVFGKKEYKGVYLSQLANPDLTWETAREINLGVDFAIIDGKVSGTIEWFNKTISDLLSKNPMPTHSVVGEVAANVGKTRSRGWELTLNTTNIHRGSFKWQTNFNMAHYKDTWLERSPEVMKTLPRYVDPHGEIRAIYGYETDGILQVGEEVPAHMPGLQPGMIKVKDLNGFDENGNLIGKPDGKLDQADNVLLASQDPGYTFGFGNIVEYKNWDLNVFMYGMLDRVLYNRDKAEAYNQMFQFGWNTLSETADRWSKANQDSKNPSGITSPYGGFAGNFYRENGAFVRVKNITLGYTLPAIKVKEKSLFSSARVYFDVQNPFVFTNYSGIDPEVSGFLSYPPQKSYVIGLNLTF
jgi:TonB-linked SusC/RagA family outer membrane protein